nr:mavicyanin-like [Lolium perenne]
MALRQMLAVAVVAGCAVAFSGATDHIVGDRTFCNPNINHTLWSGNHTFFVGDLISLRHQKGTHNVFEVNETGYNSCTMDGVAGNWTSGKDLIPLKEPRRYFFICGGNGLCQAGMKVVITVYPTPGNATRSRNVTEFHHGPEFLPDCSPDCGTAASSITTRLMVAALAVAIAAVA